MTTPMGGGGIQTSSCCLPPSNLWVAGWRRKVTGLMAGGKSALLTLWPRQNPWLGEEHRKHLAFTSSCASTGEGGPVGRTGLWGARQHLRGLAVPGWLAG